MSRHGRWTWQDEHDASEQPGRDGVGVGDGARVRLGLVAYTAMGREGQTGCEATEWESETSVRCLVGQGARGTRRVVMTAGERGGSMTEGCSWTWQLSMRARSNVAGRDRRR